MKALSFIAAASAMAYFPPGLFKIHASPQMRSPSRNQRKIRKTRRQRHAAGDRNAFKR